MVGRKDIDLTMEANLELNDDNTFCHKVSIWTGFCNLNWDL
jgi:hypothetical protein